MWENSEKKINVKSRGRTTELKKQSTIVVLEMVVNSNSPNKKGDTIAIMDSLTNGISGILVKYTEYQINKYYDY